MDMDIHGEHGVYRYIHGYYAGVPANYTEYLYALFLYKIFLSVVFTPHLIVPTYVTESSE